MTSVHVPGTPVLSGVRMHLHTPPSPAQGTVVSTARCTASPKAAGVIRHITFDVSGTQLAGNIRPGQSFGVLAPGKDERGLPHKLRLYSVSSPTAGEDGQGNVIATTVKRLIDEHHDTHRLFLGVASNYLCDLAVGDKVQLTGPSGKRFVLPADPSAHDYLFFATGTGIAPFRGMLMDLYSRPGPGAPRSVLLLGSPYASDLPYDRQFRELAAAQPGFRYLPTLSRERRPDGQPGLYVQDQLTLRREEFSALLGSERTLIYVCGIAGMELGIFQAIWRLPEDVRRQYLDVDPQFAGDSRDWTRKLISKEVRHTRRVFLEVY